MPEIPTLNRRVVLAARPDGLPRPEDFRLEEVPVPQPGEGEVLLRTVALSLDPYMRELMDERGPLYTDPLDLGATMSGGTVSRVVASRHPGFREGALVLGNAGWQDLAVSDGQDLMPLDDLGEPSHALGVLGMPGFTAYVGLLDIGRPKPGETVVVAAATGAVGAVVGQIAKLQGAHVVGVAGGAEKCAYAVDELGLDACVDRRDPRFAELLGAACPDGIDVYFENVGGAVLDAVLPLLNDHARVPLCGLISQYNDDDGPAPGPDRLPRAMATLHQRRVHLEGFIILDHYDDRFEDFRRDMGRWLADGRVRAHEDVVNGLEHAAGAFIGLLEGRNHGKLLVRVADA